MCYFKVMIFLLMSFILQTRKIFQLIINNIVIHVDLKLYSDKPQLYSDKQQLYSDKLQLYSDKPQLYSDKQQLYSDKLQLYSGRLIPILL